MSRKIMIVDDDQPILELMEILIRRIGYEPLSMTDVVEALETVKQDPPALVLLDVMMSPVDGWQFLAKVREEFGMWDLPVVLFTASPLVEERIAQMNDPRLGMLQKPVSLDELRTTIRRFLA